MRSDAELDQDGQERLARLREIAEDLAREEFTAVARSGRVRAVVDGEGTLRDLRIADAALTVRGLDLDALNGDILEAVTGARQLAAERAAHLVRTVFPALLGDGR